MSGVNVLGNQCELLRRLREVLLVVHGGEGDWVPTLALLPPGSASV